MQNLIRKCLAAGLALAVTVGTANAPAQSFSGVSGSYAAKVIPGYSWLRINAFLNVPLAGADVAVYDTAGDRIFQQEDATNNQGVFPASINNLPRDFRVTVTFDGNVQQDPGLGGMGQFTLSADERDFDPVYGIVYVDPATTLVSLLLEHEPGLSIQQARALVRRFLGLPQDASLGAALRQDSGYQSPYFSETAFVSQAQQQGGMEAFVKSLASQMMRRSLPTHSFASGPAAALGNPLAFIGTSLAYGALSYLGGQGVGWVLGIGGKPAPPGTTVVDISDVQKGLADLQSSVDDLNKQLQLLSEQISAKLTKTQYNQIVAPALALAEQVNVVERNLWFYADGCPPILEGDVSATQPFDDFCDSQRKTIAAQLNEVVINSSFNVLSGYLLDKNTVGFKGMIHLYSQSLGETVRFFRPADSTKMQNMFEYWEAVQTQAANLYVELLHLNGAQNNKGGIQQLTAFLGDVEADPVTLGTFQNTFAAERKLMFPAVPVNTFINVKDRTMWRTDFAVDYGNCGVPPTGDGAWNYPLTQAVSIQGLEWLSPSQVEAKALIDGWTGSSPNQWLINQTRAVPPDTPVSPGFPDIANFHTYCPVPLHPTYPAIWTRDYTGKTVEFLGKEYKTAYKLNLIKTPGDEEVVGFVAYNWLALDRVLDEGEQYYWYSDQ